MNRTDNPQKSTIHGIVTANEWNSDDEIISYRIMTRNEEEFVISAHDAEDMFEYLYDEIELTGIIDKQKGIIESVAITGRVFDGNRNLIIEDNENSGKDLPHGFRGGKPDNKL